MLNKLYVSTLTLFTAIKQIKQSKVVKSIIDSQVMQMTLRNNYMSVLRNVFKFLHPSIQI